MKWKFCKISDLGENDYKTIYSGLSPSRKAHVDRLKNNDDRLRSLAATFALIELLNELGERGAILETDSKGRPYLSGSNLFVSLSHSSDGVAAAISCSKVGIDIEKIKPINERLIDYVCNDGEKEYILRETANGTPQNHAFLTVWTAKEAFLKQNSDDIKNIRTVDTATFEKTVYFVEDFIITIVN